MERSGHADAKQSYKITYPNGKIYVGMDLTGSLLYVGTPSARQQIADDLDAHRFDLTLRKQIHWESETATDAEVRVMEAKLAQTIPRLGATNRLITARPQRAIHDNRHRVDFG